MDDTTITIKDDTKSRLNQLRKGGETWDKFFKRLLSTKNSGEING